MILKRSLMGLVAIGAMVALVSGQPPVKPDEKKAEAKKPTFDEIIAASVRNDADVKIAAAEVQLATAKLSAVKLAAARKVTLAKEILEAARAEVQAAKAALQMCEVHYENDRKNEEDLLKMKTAVASGELNTAKQKTLENKSKLELARTALEAAMSKYSRLQGEWNRLSEPPAQPQIELYELAILDSERDKLRVETFRAVMQEAKEPKPATPATVSGLLGELRTALDKSLEIKSMDGIPLTETMEHLQQLTSFSGRIRLPQNINPQEMKLPRITKSTMPFSSWLQLIADEVSESIGTRYDFYVRDYGLQLATPDTAAPGAVPLATFLKTSKPDPAKK